MLTSSTGAPTVLIGEAKQWHGVTLEFDAPAAMGESRETFYDHRLDVTFRHEDGTEITVPGFFAADGDAAETGATSGTKWQAVFNPPKTGDWSYEVSFRTGDDIAASLDPLAGTPVAGIDGASGSLTIGASDKTGDDLRAKGVLAYDGDRYLNFQGDGSVFLKSGVGSPENLLGYSGFDNTADRNTTHDFGPHIGDFDPGDPSWDGGRGQGIIGAVNYLAENAVNSAYMMLNNIGGDGREVSPWADPALYDIPKNPGAVIDAEDPRVDAFDVSKLAQWDIVFRHMEEKGVVRHFFFQETENDQMLNGGDLGVERAVYMREMIARFGYQNGVIWNLGEENTNSYDELADHSAWVKALDPYGHAVALHTYPGQHGKYRDLAGTGVVDVISIQTGNDSQNFDFDGILDDPDAAAHPYAAFYDEPGNAGTGLAAEGDPGWEQNHLNLRAVLWTGYTEGGGGAEWYFGYQTAGGDGGDLRMEDFALRESAYDWAANARVFFEGLPIEEMGDVEGLVSGVSGGDHVFAKEGEVYVVYLPEGGAPSLDLSGWQGTFDVLWFDPVTGAYLEGGVTEVTGGGTVGLGAAPSSALRAGEDWVALVTAEGVVTPDPTDPPRDPGEGGGTGGEGTGAFREEGGLVVIEMESAPSLPGSWRDAASAASGDIDNPADATGDDFIVWEGGQYFNDTSMGRIEYQVEITNPGSYLFEWRSQTGQGTDTTEHNDTWVKIDADRFYATQNDGSIVRPKGAAPGTYPEGAALPEGSGADGFFKVYASGAGDWRWSARTSDNDAHAIKADFDEPGIYTITIAARSSSHAIDRMVLVNEAIYEGNARDLTLPESPRSGATTPPDDDGGSGGGGAGGDGGGDGGDPPAPFEATLHLVDAATDTRVETIEDGETIALSALQGNPFSIEAIPGTGVGSVVFDYETPSLSGSQTENVAPYAIFGDRSGDFAGEAFLEGEVSVTARFYSGSNGGGTLLGTVAAGFTVAEAAVEPVNAAPMAGDDAAAVVAGQETVIPVLDNDQDPEGGALTIEILQGPAMGSARVVAGGIAYTGDAAWADSLTYRVLDPEGAASEPATVSLTVEPDPDAGGGEGGGEGGADDGVDGGALLTFAFADTADDATLFALMDGDEIPAGAFGADPVSIFAMPGDAADAALIESVQLSLSGPVAGGPRLENFEPYALFGDRTELGDFMAGITFLPGDYALTVTAYSADFAGGTVLGTETVAFTVTAAPPANRAPVAVADTAATDEDMAVAIDVLANDADAEGGPLTIEIVDAPAVGSATVKDGKIVYTPDRDANGEDSLSYRVVDAGGLASAAVPVSITIRPVNDAPVLSDIARTIDRGAGQESVTLSGADFGFDPDGTTLYFLDVTGTGKGEATLAGEASILQWAPDPGFVGTEELTVLLWDQIDDTVVGEATLTVEVAGTVEDPDDPAETLIAAVNLGGGAYRAADGTLYAADTISNARSYSVTAPIAGTLDDPLFQTEAWSPSGLSYAFAADGLVRVEVDLAEIWPGAQDPGVRIFDIALEGAVVEAGIDLAAEPGFRTATTKVYEVEVTDGTLDVDFLKGLQNPKASAIRVYELGAETAPTPPEVEDIAREIDEDTALTLSAAEFGAGPLAIAGVLGAENGIVEIAPTGASLVYTPDPDWNGAETLTLSLVDPAAPGLAATAALDLTVAPVNDPAVTTDLSVEIEENAAAFAVTIAAEQLGTDPDGDTVYVFDVLGAENGEVTIAGEGSILFYTPDPDFAGTETLTVRLWDQIDDSVLASAGVEIVVQPEPAAEAVRFNAGGPAFTDSDGNAWASDAGIALNGRLYAKGPFSADGPDAVYGTERYAKALAYEIPLADGVYDLTLKFAEIYFNEAGRRVFDAEVEGVQVIDDLDLFASSGAKFLAHDVLIEDVAVTDGVLDIDFAASVNNAKLSGIVIAPASPEEIAALSASVGPRIALEGDEPVGPFPMTAEESAWQVNAAPDAIADLVRVGAGDTVEFDVLANDSDPEGDAISLLDFMDASEGGLVHLGDGRFRFTAEEDGAGETVFTYTVTDAEGSGRVSEGTVVVAVSDPADESF